MTTAFFTAPDGARLAYHDNIAGTPAKTPILCLSGLTRDMRDFDYVSRHLRDVRLIRMDYRGRGESEWTGADSYTVPTEGGDVLALLDHLGLDKVAILGSSRGGLVAMYLAATAKDRLAGICFNDVGPQLLAGGLAHIATYLGVAPTIETLAEAADRLPLNMAPLGFANVPPSRWADEAVRHYVQGDGRLELTYDPDLRVAFDRTMSQPAGDAWPLFDACADLPLALIHGAGSNLLGADGVAEMRRRRPDMIYAEVPDRGHIPFLDEPEALTAIARWREMMG